MCAVCVEVVWCVLVCAGVWLLFVVVGCVGWLLLRLRLVFGVGVGVGVGVGAGAGAGAAAAAVAAVASDACSTVCLSTAVRPNHQSLRLIGGGSPGSQDSRRPRHPSCV